MKYEDQLSSILIIFESSFKQEYKRLTYRKKSKLLRYLSSFYRRWYHSALIENTILTPSNLVANLNSEFMLPTGGVPYPVISGVQKINNFEYKLLHYSLDDHPVVRDLKVFAEHCEPDIELNEYDMPIESAIDGITPFLSLNDPFYVEYLCQIALNMRILEKLPSIYANKARLAVGYEATLGMDSREIFLRIFDASIEIATNFLVQSVPIKGKKISSEFILTALREPVTTEELFERIYKILGINLDNMVNFTGDIFDELYQAMISSTFFLGLLIDRYFFTVFGFYLKIINPGYTLAFDMRNELEYVVDGFREMDDLSSGFFAPCSNYTLTELGMEFLSIKPTAKNTVCFPNKLKTSAVITQVLAHLGNPAQAEGKLKSMGFTEPQGSLPSIVFMFKITVPGIKPFWKNIEFDDKTTLEQMYIFICQQFGFDINNKYSFFVGTEESPFFEYSPPSSKKRTKKTDEQLVAVLADGEKAKSLLLLYGTINILNGDIIPAKSIRIKLELMRSRDYQPDSVFPIVRRSSAAFREIEDMF